MKETPFYFCQARIFHRRLDPILHQFQYKVYYLFFPLKFTCLLKRFWLSLDRFNLFSFYQKDHQLKNSSASLLDQAETILKTRGLPWHEEHVWLLTFPRVLGYVFSPLSLWFCFTLQRDLYAVLAEVHNTFQERHIYLLCSSSGSFITADQWLTAQKMFHVSPFLKIEGEYQFRFVTTDKKLGVWINYYINGKKILETSIIGQRRPLTNTILLQSFLRSFWMTLGVILRIHFQAYKLWRKKVPFYSKPLPPKQEISS